MPKVVMKRSASDNEHLHKDFHGALSAGIEYLDQHYGSSAVREYLREFVLSYYAPLITSIKELGLAALKEHFESIYSIEGAAIKSRLTGDELIIEVDACPAVVHMREHGYKVAGLFSETTRTVSEALCEGTLYGCEVLEYDEQTGRSIQRFYRRRP